MDIIIRKFIPPDIEGIRFLKLGAATEEDSLLVTGAMEILKAQDPSIISYVAEDNGLVVGFNVGFILPTKVLIPEGMYVDPDFRRRGIAKRLSGALEKGSGCLVSMAYYKPSLKDYYSKLGYFAGENVIVGIKKMEEE